ncbi:hypothetical protein PFICI_00152 [Pestalotiopsis fici W106-1]|uniref:Carrier domain-containing protein n=1 Tax=Pestalotiopsis fici (strain W106-1 / CGMCC3.15140) TaxID=1229662 RepID=W3XJX6_PESFW|nr:uncharacterized protein PFICI_00152 [Pestalotiopsis fici W106-1]ETS86324.1 hypothetical protein PFICI_00152 [Pestalotiopsis fici W106-1]
MALAQRQSADHTLVIDAVGYATRLPWCSDARLNERRYAALERVAQQNLGIVIILNARNDAGLTAQQPTMAPLLDYVASDQRHDHDYDVSLKSKLEGFAASALDISLDKFRKQSYKTWLALGGDSLTAVNFMGSCHEEAGIEVDIPDILQSGSVADLIDRIARSHQTKESTSNGTTELSQNGHGNGSGNLSSNGNCKDVTPGGLSDVLQDSLDEIQGVGPCSPMQENFLALQSMDSRAYQLQLAARISSTNPAIVVNPESIKQSWSAVVKRHVALRTTFVESVDRPGRFDQVVWSDLSPQISILPLHEAESKTSHQYGSGSPYHLVLAQVTGAQTFMKLFISHIIMDGVSTEILLRDLCRALAGILPVEESLKYEDLLYAQQPDTSSETLSYWSQYLLPVESTFLSSPNSRTSPTGPYSIHQDMQISPELARNLSEQHNTTLVNACQVAYALVLRSYTGADNVCFSYTTSGRHKRIKGLHDAVGNFVNTLPCRVDFSETKTVVEALRRMQGDFLSSLPYQGASLTDKREMSGSSLHQLSDSLLSFHRAPHDTVLARAGFDVDVVSWESSSDYNYTLMIKMDQQRLGLRFDVWESLISRDDALNILQLFRDSLDFVLQNSSQPCLDFIGLTAHDQSAIISSNQSPPAIVRDCVHDQVWATAIRQPDRPAICAWDGELTYSELGIATRRLATYLVSLGVGREVNVGLCMDKSLWAPVVMLAILQAGGVVVPFGNQHPPNRIQTMADNATVTILLADREHTQRLAGVIPRIIEVDGSFIGQLPTSNAVPWPKVSPEDTAWIVHTSGSTGVPKGVVLQHQALCTPMQTHSARYGMGPWTRALQFSAHTFDVTIMDIFTTLTFGGCVCIPSESQRVDDLGAAIKTLGVTFATLTPTVASLLDPQDLPTLNTLITTGEALTPAVAHPWLEVGKVKFFNAYGPSECTYTSTINGPLTSSEEATSVGFPAANCLWITDPRDFNRLSPIGAIGELLVEGPIAREYLHDPEKTASFFVIDPGFVKKLGLAPGRRMYRTGDLVRQAKDGSLIYLGRKDTQIKIRGQRVEILEIENRIAQSLPGNSRVCVDLVQAHSSLGSSLLIAAIEMPEVASQGSSVAGTLCDPSEDLKDLLQKLRSKLLDEFPLYMVPSHFVPFLTFATSASGKLDRRVMHTILERLTESQLSRFNKTAVQDPISTETEKTLQGIWAVALGRPSEEISRNDHFVQLGGDSVVAMRMTAIARRSNISLSVADIIRNPRLADMARVMDGSADAAERAAKEDPEPFALWSGFLKESEEEQKRRLTRVAEQCNILPSLVIDVYPASPLQEALMAMTSQQSGTYVVQQVFRLDSKVNLEQFEKSWTEVAASLAILRTRIVYTPDSGSVQVVIQDSPPWATASNLSSFLDKDRVAPFTYGTPLHRFAIVDDSTRNAHGSRERYFVWTAHHSAYDAHTITRIFETFARVFQGRPYDTETPLPRFMRYLEENNQNGGWERSATYWKKELDGAQLARFPEVPSPSYRPFAGGRLRHRLQQLQRPGGDKKYSNRVSVATILRAAWALVVASRTGNDEALFTEVLSGRDLPVPGIDDVVMPTVTSVPTRIRTDRKKAVVEYLSLVESQSRNTAPYAQFGLANIRRAVPGLGHDFDPGHLFIVQPGPPLNHIALAEMVGVETIKTEIQNFEGYALVVECTLDTDGAGIHVEMRFDEAVLSSSQAVALMAQLEHVAHTLQAYNRPDPVLDHSERSVAIEELDLVSSEDKEKLLKWNGPSPNAIQSTLDQLVREKMAKTPHSLAVCSWDGDLTYSQLDAAAESLAQHLVLLGVGPESLVGLCMDKSKFAVVSALAIQRAGGAVTPLGVQYPIARIQTILMDANISVVLVDIAQSKRFNTLVSNCVVVNNDLLGSLLAQDMTALSRASPSTSAWVIYTSGSTGVPKGVVLENQALCSSILAHGTRFGFTPSTRTFQFSAFTFDNAIQDFFTTLAFGGCVCIPSEQDRMNDLASAMKDLAVTFSSFTPTVLSLLDPESVPISLECIALVGEAVKPAVVQPWLGRVKLINAYGPAECSIHSAINDPMLFSEDASIIGYPVSNHLWVTNSRDHNSLVPIGAPGELLIEGPTLARGYLNDNAKTSKSFVLDPDFIKPLHLPPGRRMYRTGDLVRQRSDGRLVYLGRLDTQMKVRGQRIEAGEIESHIVSLQPQIRQACIDLVQVQSGADSTLLAAVELLNGFQVDDDNVERDEALDGIELPEFISRPSRYLNTMLGELRNKLLQVLPPFMVPTHFIPLSLPVNASGKLNRQATRAILEALTREQLRAFSVDQKNTGEDRMLSETEIQLRLLWAEVLGLQVEEIGGANDDFIQLGGDSVVAMRLVAAAQRAPIPMQLGVAEILQNPRLEDMARVSSEHTSAAIKASEADPVPFELWDGFQGAGENEQEERLTAVIEQCDDLTNLDEIVDVYPSTPLQEGLMAVTFQQPTAYVAQQVFRLGADVDIPRLQRAWEQISNKLAILRTRMAYTAGGSVQFVVRTALRWEFQSGLQTYLEHDKSVPFSYGTPLHRLAIVQDDSNRYFVWTGHHAAYDGWSLLRIFRMLVQVYQTGEDSLAVVPVSRFVRYLQERDEHATAAYWGGQLEGAELIQFPPLPSPNYQPHADSFLQIRLDGFCGEHVTSSTLPKAVLLRAAWAATVATYTGASEAIINVALSGRDAPVPDIGNIIGPTVTTVPVRIKAHNDQSVDAFLDAVDQQAKEMVPFAQIGLHGIRNVVSGLDSDFDPGHLFIIQPAPTGGELEALDAIGLHLDTAITDRPDFGGYALAVDCIVDADSINMEFRYDSHVLPHERATAILSQFEHTFRQLELHGSKHVIADLDLFSPADADTVRGWNQRPLSAKQACIHELIRVTAEENPQSPAVNAWNGEFTYATLYATARKLASHLSSDCGVGPEVTVGLCMDKSRWAVVSMLAILMAGGVVVPLGVQQPLARVGTITMDSKISTILVDNMQSTRLVGLEGISPRLIVMDAAFLEKLQSPQASGPICDAVSPGNAAWIVYTSGSTGVPKGVVLEHQALCSSIHAHGPRFGLDTSTRALQFAAHTFDAVIEDIFSVLVFGGCVCVPSEGQRLNELTDTIRDFNVNFVNITSTVASLIDPADVPMIKTLLFGGETVSPAVVEKWLGHAKMMNSYGPSECCVDVSCSAPIMHPRDAHTVGFPLDVSFWVTSQSDYNRLVPVGTPGELLVEGPLLARGYLNDPGKTAEAFVWDPEFVTRLGLSTGRRMYRTGDHVQQNPDGSLIHLGRIDSQIKIRGQRVEAGEVESNIVRCHREVRGACVDLIRPRDISGDPIFMAAIDVGEYGRDENDDQGSLPPQILRQPTQALRIMIQSLRADLLSVLPRYMVPSFVPMTSLPVNVSSKLDRRATREVLSGLSREELGAFEKAPESAESRPLSPMENQLREIWVEVLGCSPNLGPEDHFILLGGDSITAMRLVTVAQKVDIHVGVADVLQNPRLSDLARVAESYDSAKAAEEDPSAFELWDDFTSLRADLQQEWLTTIAERCGGLMSQDIEDVYPSTPLQEGLMAMTAQQPGAYVTQNLFRIQGIDVPRFKAAWVKLMDLLTILRTRIVYHRTQSGALQVVVRKALDWNETTDLQNYLAQDLALPFAYGTPLHRLAIILSANGEAEHFVWTQHHSGYDGYQNALTLKMLSQLYQHGVDQHHRPTPVSRFMKYLQQAADGTNGPAYWKQQLEGAQVTRFPPLLNRAHRPQAANVLHAQLEPDKNLGVTLPTLLRAAWAATVATYTGSQESVLNVALSGRDLPLADIASIVAPTVTTVPVRIRVDPKQTVSKFLAEVEDQSKQMVPYMHFGIQNIRKTAGLGQDFEPGHLFVVQPAFTDDSLEGIGLEEPTVVNNAGFSGYPLIVQCTVNADARDVNVEVQFDEKVLPLSRAEALVAQFEHFLQLLSTHGRPGAPPCSMGQLNLLNPIDAATLRQLNQETPKAHQKLIHDLVKSTVDQQPSAPAVSAWDGELSYGELDGAARRLAHHLVTLGVRPEVKVGVCMDKSRWAVVSMYAILQAGGVVVPLGVQFPVSRLATIIANAEVAVTLLDSAQAVRLEGVAPQPTVVDASFLGRLAIGNDTMPACTEISPSNAAWIVYTSGSTGTPKGSVLEHKALSTSLLTHGPLLNFGPQTRALNFSAYTFDITIQDLFTTLIFGGCVCVPSEFQRLNDLEAVIRSLQVNTLHLTTTVASLITPASVPLVKSVIFGGEAVTPAVVDMWLGHATLINTYGPSECCINSSYSLPIQRPEDASVVGFPVAGCFWVTDVNDYNRLCPLGAPGQLLIEGPLLAREYLGASEKTETSFIVDPGFVSTLGWATDSGPRRMYCTGDLVRQNSDGSLVHLGRCDAQIKIRGQRVETGEIESHITRVESKIQRVCVDLVHPSDSISGEPVLLAALEMQADQCSPNGSHEACVPAPANGAIPPTSHFHTMVQKVRSALGLVLPFYMIPHHFVPFSSLPMNASGKLDRRAICDVLSGLSYSQLGAYDRSLNAEDRPLTFMEQQLQVLWAEVLGRPAGTINADDDFIRLGGDSVTAMRLVALAQRKRMNLGVADILQNPRLADLASVAEEYGERALRVAQADPTPFELCRVDATDREEWLASLAEQCGVAPSSIVDAYPTTALQEGLMAITAQQPGAYVAQNVFRIRRDVDKSQFITHFQSIWAELMTILPILRTRIVYATQSGSVQIVLPDPLHWDIVDSDLSSYLARDQAVPFAYGTPLHRLAIVRTLSNKDDAFFVWSAHHAGYDGASMLQTFQLLAQVYQGEKQIATAPIPRFIKYLEQADKAQATEYWRLQLADANLTRFPPLPHPLYRPRADSVAQRRIRNGGTQSGTPVAILLRAAWAMTIASYTGSTESTSTVALSGRDIPVLGIENAVVPTLATVPVKTRFDDPAQPVSNFLASVERQTEEMRPFIHTGIQHIRAAVPGLGSDYDPGHLFIIQPIMEHGDRNPLQTLGLEPIVSDNAEFGGYALAVQCTVSIDHAVDVELRFDQEIIPPPMAEGLLSQFEHLLQMLENGGDTPIGKLDLFNPADLERVQRWNKPALQAEPEESCIHDLVQVMVDKQPQAQAVSSWDGALSYSELNRAACTLAHHLASLGVGPEVTVGICMDKSLWAVISMLAILQAGGVVVALGTQHPPSRIKTIIADADIHVVLVDKAQAKRLPGVAHSIVVEASFIEQLPASTLPPHSGVSPNNAAWIIYTSGSTGTPKGVVLEHKSLCKGIKSHGTLFGNSSKTRALQFASHTFGVVIEDMFTTLIFGGCTCIPSEDERLDMKGLAHMMRRTHVNFVNLTSTAASLIDPCDVPEIETIVLGGEAVRPAVVKLWKGHAKILNAYGQSECSVESVISMLSEDRDASNIGFPIAGSAAWVVDPSDYTRLVPVGAPGELLIQGPLLARGYLNDAAKTAASFISGTPLLTHLGISDSSHNRMYCTGDLVRQNADGSLIYLGRRDGQIKVRGQRVEVGEIESLIVQLYPEVSHAFVDLVESQNGTSPADLTLVAAIELQETGYTQVGEESKKQGLPMTVRAPTKDVLAMIQRIRTDLLQELPPYMVPGYFVPISGHLPINASGKLDRRAAREIIKALTPDQLRALNRIPSDPGRLLSRTEEHLRAAYAGVLGCSPEDIGLHDQFIQLGGDSVAAMHVAAACRKRGVRVSVRDVLQQQSISALSTLVEIRAKDGTSNSLPNMPAESSGVTDAQESVLNHHVSHPDVDMTYFAMDGKTTLGVERMVNACKQLITSIEALHTGFIRKDDKWERLVLSSFKPEVLVYVTEDTIDQWTESFVHDRKFGSFELGRPLADIAICIQKQTGAHRILFRFSHAIYDGMSLPKFWAILQQIYADNQTEQTASFSQYVAQVEHRRSQEASGYWTRLLQNTPMTPIGDSVPRDHEFVWRAQVIGPKTIELGQNIPMGMTCASVLKAAWAIVLANHAERDQVVFADIVSGRAGVDSSVGDVAGCCATPMPVCVRLDLSSTYLDLVQAVQKQHLDSMPFETFGFGQIAQHCTDWPAGTIPTSVINHAPTRVAGSKIEIGDTEYTICQPKQSEQDWTYSNIRIAWQQVDGELDLSLVYAVDHVTSEVAQRLYDDLIFTIQRILTSPHALIQEQLPTST